MFIVSLVAFSIYASLTASTQQHLATESSVARAEAIAERDKVRATNQRLAEELQRSTLAYGRPEAASGSTPLAKDLLWRAYLSNPTSEDARWALREMYNTLPTLWTVQGLKDPEATCFSKDGSRAAIINTHGTLAVYETAKGTEVFRKDALGELQTCICFLADSTACLIGFAR